MSTRITWNGREVTNPWARGPITCLIVAAICLLIVMMPLMVALHPLFRLFRRAGTIRQEAGGRLSIVLDRTSFRRRT